ncbi:ATP-binding cassette subfamily B protein [Thermocatellispora tengchongensis]|uniref:ATP-binding cassette subfamily B protein n=1 Tax=Thermocatellispora tengchongensis TaxID=1073253 RepID=A0A840P9Y6_9ACTN|nr:ABC transporter ATP-binding protein [Thermocatellispora tengchongensis]MBB5135456.1 ATP-binding cassette subfamily B protein [Thermocatellispora tengchongensis]
MKPPVFAQMLAPVRGRLAVAVLLQALAAVAGVVPMIAVSEVAAALLGGGARPERVWWLVAAGTAAVLVSLLCAAAASTVAHVADNALQLRLRRDLVRHLARVPLGWFSATNSGQVKKVVQDDIHSMHYLVAHTLLDVTSVVLTPVTALAYLLGVDWRLALVTLLPLAAGLALFARAMSGAGPLMAEYGRAAGEINSSVVEFVDGIAVVKTFGGARGAHQRFIRAADAFHDFFSRWSRRTTGVTTASQLAVSPVVVLIVVLGTGLAMIGAGWMPATDIVPFALLAPVIPAPVSGIGTRIQALRGGDTAAKSVTALLAEPVMPRPSDPEAPGEGGVRLRGVGFSYDGAAEVLSGVDLDLAPGTVTALVGPSGAGKSTLAKLVARFFDVTEGSITIGGVDVRRIDPAALYRTVGFVFQEVALLRGTVADNIRLARPDAPLEEVERAARAAQIHDRIQALPRGYDSEVGVDAEFSGGEAQRISIARALLADTPVLVLDEATAYADPHSEARIQQALSAVAAGRTLLVIAHRLATVREADQIVVLDSGRVVEKGRHAELLARGGRYARMWRAQEPAQESRRTDTVVETP